MAAIRRRKIDCPLSDKATEACFTQDLGRVTDKKIHIERGGYAVSNQLGRSNFGSNANELAVSLFLFQRQNGFKEPLRKRQVVGKATEERHCEMGVRVNKAR
jgi:hypothetical protein